MQRREAMRDRGKAVETYNNNYFADYYSSSSDLLCKKHPSASSVGICAYCLKDRLSKLVCSECGEQRLSSCSCSDISPTRNSCTGEVGSVGRISFLIENEKNDLLSLHSSSKPRNGEKIEEVLMLKRSSSSCVEIKKNGFWNIGKFFRMKKKEKHAEKMSVSGCDEKSDLSMVDYMGVSRSRSLCSFRGGEFYGSENGEYLPVSAARSSISAARSSSVTGGLILDAGRKSGFSEAEPRRSGFSETEPRKSCFSESENRKSCFSEAEARRSGCSESEARKSSFDPENGIDIRGMKKVGTMENDNGPKGANRRIFSLKESDFNGVDDSSFIDLKIDFSSELNKEQHPNAKMGTLLDTKSAFGSNRASDLIAPEFGGSLGCSVGNNALFSKGGSCRITVRDRGIKTGRKSFKGWRWIFKPHPNVKSGRSKTGDGSVI